MTAWEITVAKAAPCIPQENPKMKIGARIAFSNTLMSIDNMAILGLPSPRMAAFRPKATVWNTVPSTMIRK